MRKRINLSISAIITIVCFYGCKQYPKDTLRFSGKDTETGTPLKEHYRNERRIEIAYEEQRYHDAR